jgi:hypothetical protein
MTPSDHGVPGSLNTNQGLKVRGRRDKNIRQTVPVDSGVSRHIIDDGDLYIIIFIEDQSWTRKLAVGVDEIARLPIWRSLVPSESQSLADPCGAHGREDTTQKLENDGKHDRVLIVGHTEPAESYIYLHFNSWQACPFRVHRELVYAHATPLQAAATWLNGG